MSDLESSVQESEGQWTAALRSGLKSDMFRKVAETLATRIAMIVVGLATTVVVSRILGPEGRGLFAAATAFAAVAIQLLNLGLHSSNVYYVSKDRSSLPVLLGNSLAVSFGWVGFLALGAWAVFRLHPAWAPVQGSLLDLTLVSIPVGLACLLLQNLILGLQDVRTYNLSDLATKVLSVILILGLWGMGRITPSSIFGVSVFVYFITLAWLGFKIRGYLGQRRPEVSGGVFREHLGYGLKAYLAALFSFLVLKVDMLMVQYLGGSVQTGYYSVAVNMADMIYMLPVVIGTILFPKLSALSNLRGKWLLTWKATALTALLLAIMGLVGMLLAPLAVSLLFGAAFLPAVSAFRWLMPGIFFIGMQSVMIQYLNSLGFPIRVVYAWFFTFLLNVGLNFVLIPKYGFVGAAANSTISYFFIFLVNGFLVWKERPRTAAAGGKR